MTPGRVSGAILLLVATSIVLQVAASVEDLYWEGEEDPKNEYLEVKDDEGLGRILTRVRRQFGDFFNIFGPTKEDDKKEEIKENDDHVDEEVPSDHEDEERESNFGSGTIPDRDPELREKTLRVSFVVMEPYQPQYSNRDSEQFQNLSKSLADAVNVLFEALPGTQKASLVRIQSRSSDEFSCKVTLDISTIGYDDTGRITKLLRDHIREQMKLGSVTVKDTDFHATPIDPDVVVPECPSDEFQCSNGNCVPASVRCNGVFDCSDGQDEYGCVEHETTTQTDPRSVEIHRGDDIDITEQRNISDEDIETDTEDPSPGECRDPLPCVGTFETYCPEKRCDGVRDCPRGDDEVNCGPSTTGAPNITECSDDMIRCDQTRCVSLQNVCDGFRECDDGKDEENCEQETCGADDFRCDNGKCIPEYKHCDRTVDCSNHEDESNCDCSPDEHRCSSDGACIELRKVCDGVPHCTDGSDEQDCPTCSSGQWQCDHGSCIRRTQRCDGRVDCPTDRSDERNCIASGYFRCRSGKYIPQSQRCNRHYDCPPGDHSDEKNCPCGVGDFKCDNEYCIPYSKRCDRTNDCQDGSDERNCKYEEGICMASEFKCLNGECVPADARCNSTAECTDSSDEAHCPCKRDEFRCRDMSCINIAQRCNGYKDCRPGGEDELNCGAPEACPSYSIRCANGECGEKCNGVADCDDGEDEQGCDESCHHRCDGLCLDDNLICNGQPDCSDGSDEVNCDNCDGPNDFRCRNGECIKASLRCNGLVECADGTDEESCNNTMIPVPEGCTDNQYQCRNGACIDKQFLCDRHTDCTDGSDEEACLWYSMRSYRSPLKATNECHESQFTCYDGRCIPHLRRCDNIYDCLDFSDEQSCHNSACDDGQYQCASGLCIPSSSFCDGIPDCPDNSDELTCATPAPPYQPDVYTPRPAYQPNNVYTTRPAYQPDIYTPRPAYKPEVYTPRPAYQPEVYTPRPAYPREWSTQSPDYGRGNQDSVNRPAPDGCNRNEWRCENGPCINSNLRCNGHVDCPYDDTDELDCPNDSPVALNLKTYPNEQTVRYSGDVVFQCRDEGPYRAPVRWVREGGRPLKPGSIDRNGRLEMYRVTPSDAGTYVCQATKHLGYPGSELRVTLTVTAQSSTSNPHPFPACQSYEATCGNGQCIAKSLVCDGKRDCNDGSDEDECNLNGACEPNQFECANRRCVLKTWLCDSEDDCGDGSDERDCGTAPPGEACLPTEYACRTNNQCIPKSFHCDKHNDCFDSSDELGCGEATIRRPPHPQNLKLQPGETLTLTCDAVGIPTPLISWRLNWGHVPPKCRATSVDGVGTLTCPNMQPEDSGAYSCEAINRGGTAFAVPDAIVFVTRTSVCPTGYFNSEAHSPSECVRCFCFGESSQCKSADLFTYNMPTPLGEGGTRLLGVKPSYTGNITIDTQPITDLFYYQPLRNGAMVTKLETYASRSSHPYITLPESYNGNQLTSYGGYIKYRLQPHTQRLSYDNNVPDIIIKGKYETLLHYHPQRNDRDRTVNARLVPENWQKASPRGLVAASREDIMMALDNIEMIMLRSDLNGAGANITDFTMESAQHINAGLGAATLVEECQCPPGYEGLSCQKCASGFMRKKSGPWLGNCVPEERTCPPGTYGNPSFGLGCQPCPCPLTNRENQFARTCSLGSNGRVICDCMPGYEGANCESCAPGFMGNPMVPGDSCRPRPVDNCSPIGTVRFRLPDQCECKENVQGRYCDQCNDYSFFLSEDFRHGCAQCFCSGVTQQCSSSSLRRKTSTVLFNVPPIVNQVKVYKSTQVIGANRYNAPVETALTPSFSRGELTLNNIDRARPIIYYWSLPVSFAGDKVTSYGGYLRYTMRNVPTSNQYTRNNAADIQLISDNRLIFHYFGNFAPSSDGYLNASVQFLETGWLRSDGKEVLRENLLLALADVNTILIKATYTNNDQLGTLVSASIDTAESTGDGPQALHVEQCVCPTGYLGTSCEDCAPGYTRDPGGLYLGLCRECNCNGHSDMCDPETGVCYDCSDNTDGENCESCKPGYERDRLNNCVPNYRPPDTVDCNCDPRGEETRCEDGRCVCKQNVEGDRCDRCRPGSFGLSALNPDGCTPCYCSGVTSDCHEGLRYTRVPIPAPIFGDDFGGYTLMNLDQDSVINDQFVPAAHESDLMYVFSNPPNEDLYWSLPQFPGNRVLSYGGNLSLTQRFDSGGYDEYTEPGVDVVLVGDDLTLYWTNPETIREGQSLSYKVPLTEDDWLLLNSHTRASRNDFMNVLKNLKRVLVKATLSTSSKLQSTSIADVSMDTAADLFNGPPVKGVEVCMCPEGYSGTSCESCLSGYYKEQDGSCKQCTCNGHECSLGPSGDVVCNCRPPYTGRDCSSLGLKMELNPILLHYGNSISQNRRVTVACKYEAPEPLTIEFYFGGKLVDPPKYYNESRKHKESWAATHEWSTLWHESLRGHTVECKAVTPSGVTLGLLAIKLPEPAGQSSMGEQSTRPPPPQSTVIVTITSPTIKIQEVGGSVNFTCQAQSRFSQVPLSVKWRKDDGYLPQDRTYTDERAGLLLITNLQVSDSGRYICQAHDGVSMEEASATLQVPGNAMTLPSITINPTYNEYYEGDRIQLECLATGIPTPRITWQRASARALPVSADNFESYFVIEQATENDSGEYRCIATNQAGSTDRTAVITVRPRPSSPTRDRLTVNPTAVNIAEGQSSRIVCTGSAGIPSGTIGWIRQDLAEFLSNVQSDNGVLYIDGSRPENQGVYICQATSTSVAPVSVLVTVAPAGTPPPSDTPNVTVPVSRVQIPTGGSTVVDCTPSGYPLPLIKWKKHQEEFGPGVSQRDNTLVITNAREADQGYYLCEGTVSNTPVANVYVFVEIERREAPIVEIWPQGEQAVPLGSHFEFRCHIKAGIPEPDVMWDRNGGRSLSAHAQIQPQNILRFEKIEVNDEGEYTCSARNEAGTSSASAVLKVRSPPEIMISPKNYIDVVDGEPINVECRASGYPEPIVSIRKDSPDAREISQPAAGNAALRVPAASYRDEGSYKCIATSPAGTIEEPFLVNVFRGDGGFTDNDNGSGEEPEFHGQDPNFPNRPANIIAMEGQDSKLTCNASDEFAVEWSRGNGQRLQNNAFQVGNELRITGTSKSDAGYYECLLRNKYTGEPQQSAYTALQVVRMPRITLRPPTQTVLPGQSPTVECDVDGDDVLEVSWQPVDRPFSSRVETRQSTLIFHQIEVEDAGQYQCFARTRIANATGVAEVKVNEELSRPPLKSHDNEQFARVGAGVHLHCNASGRDLKTHWTKDGKTLPRSVSIKSDGSLFIGRVQKSDSGSYVCTIKDPYGRQTVNYINLHIEGRKCLKDEFECYDGSECVGEHLLCDGFPDCADSTDERDCTLRGKRLSPQSHIISHPLAIGNREESPSLVSIEQPRRPFRVGENVEVLCRTTNRDVRISWQRYGTNQFVETRTYGDGSMLRIAGVEESDSGRYRCIGQDNYGGSSYDDFVLDVTPGSGGPSYPDNEQDEVYSVRLQQTVDLPCKHNLDGPVSIEWRKEYGPLPSDVRPNEQNLHLARVSESDAGTYICRVSNSRAAVEARAILRVLGIVPSFNGNSWLSLPKLKDAYSQFDIEISIKPTGDMNGLILYNSQNQGREGDFIALQLVDGVPQFNLDTGSGPIVVKGDRPLQLNTWHTIRVNWIGTKLTMDVDNTGPFVKEWSDLSSVLDVEQPMYIGGVPDFDQLPSWLDGVSPFIGCVSILVLGREEVNIIVDSLEKYNVQECDTCSPNLCYNNGVCQEARNEHGFVCLCPAGYAGRDCSRTGEACRPGLCGPGKCSDTDDGYKCACPVTYTGKRCETQRSIEYPAFTGNAFIAVTISRRSRFFKITMKVKAASSPVPDGIIIYWAESPRGYGGFTSLAVRNGRLEFRYDLGDGTGPVILTSNNPLQVNEWSVVELSRVAKLISMTVNTENINGTVSSARNQLVMGTPLYVGGYDESIVLNNNTGVSGGFSGCIKDLTVFGKSVDIVNKSIKSANIQECSDYRDRGDIPENEIKEITCHSTRCRNGGFCRSSDAYACTCQPGFTGQYCEQRAPRDPCRGTPCVNGGTCRRDPTKRMNYSCDCPLGYAGATCQMRLELLQTVGFNGNGYLELPGRLTNYDDLAAEPVIVALAFLTTSDAVLFYQREVSTSPGQGAYLLIRVENGRVVFEWSANGSSSSLAVDEVLVTDGERHQVIAQLSVGNQGASLSVDQSHHRTGYGVDERQATGSIPDSNIYIGGIPESLNVNRYPGLNGCFEHVELMSTGRGMNLGEVAVAARNTQRCRDSLLPDIYPYFEEVDVFESPPHSPYTPFYNSSPETRVHPLSGRMAVTTLLITVLSLFLSLNVLLPGIIS